MGFQGRSSLNWPRIRMAALLAIVFLGATAGYIFRPLYPPEVAPLQSLAASAEKGRYLATVGNCSACHTAPGKAAFAGGVRFETPFGVIYSTNITPDRRNGIGEWTYAEFHAAMKDGVRPDGAHLYPVFPYTSFARLTDADIASLYLYFRTVDPVATGNHPNAMNFPFNHRELLYFWKRMFHDNAPFARQPGKSAKWNRGAYLVQGLAHCGACHTPRNMLGASEEANSLEGGTYTDRVASGAYRTWAAVDLTPGHGGLSGWSRNDISSYLKTGKNSHAVVHGPMKEVIASTRHLTDADADAIAAYLKDIPSRDGTNPLSAWAPFGPNKGRGEIMYTVHCGTCHLPDGKGNRILGVPLAGSPIVQAADPDSLINVILYGPDLPALPFSSGRTRMPPFGKRLSDDDIAAIATYLRSSYGNNAGAVSADQVLGQR